MTSIADHAVKIQTTSESNPSPPFWFGEVVLMSSSLGKHSVLSKISEQVRFARKRFGCYETIDFLAVLFGYAISGERTLEEFYQRIQPFAVPFMALFDRDQLPSRSALSRFLAAWTEAPVEALRTLFLDDLLVRPLTPDKQTGNLLDRAGTCWIVFDIDGTREAARQRALPQTDELPPAFRRLDDVCAPGYRGRKRGEVVRTRTTVSHAHSYHWLGSFGKALPEACRPRVALLDDSHRPVCDRRQYCGLFGDSFSCLYEPMDQLSGDSSVRGSGSRTYGRSVSAHRSRRNRSGFRFRRPAELFVSCQYRWFRSRKFFGGIHRHGPLTIAAHSFFTGLDRDAIRPGAADEQRDQEQTHSGVIWLRRHGSGGHDRDHAIIQQHL